MSETKEEVKQEGTFKVKKPRNLSKKDEPIKIDLSKPKTESTDAIQKQETGGLPEDKRTGDIQKVETKGDQSQQKPDETLALQEEKPIIEEIVDEVIGEKVAEEIVELGEKMEERVKAPTPEEAREVAKLPENIEKVVDFMKETGGTLEDYVRLNADYSSVDNDTLLKEYYKQTKSHLDSEEINFLIEDNFSFDEDLDEERVVRKAKLAYKEEVAKAKGHLEGLKSQYYEEIKLRPGVTQDQQKATDFFNRYNEDQDIAVKQHEAFKSNTQDYFNDEFKGFDFKVGEKKFRYGVKSPSEVADKQSNISNIIKKFLNEKGDVTDVKGYHKAMYAAEHADTIAQHFYEQGKSDATKDLVAKSKNISDEIRSTPTGDVFVGGLKVKAISGMDSSKLRIQKRKFN
tara:strand:- start:642 stop:1844 length:1203 start_codon:yes stop_codon:yes gene_type:complete